MKFNGNITFTAPGAGEIRNAVIEKMTTSLRNSATKVAGRIVYDTTESAYYWSDGTDWFKFADSAAINTLVTNLQTEVDAIETSSGGIFTSNGGFDGTGLDALANVAGSSSLLNALSQLDAAITTAAGVDALADQTDVTLTGPLQDNDVLAYDTTSSRWIDQTAAQAGLATDIHTHVLGGLSDVNASPAATADILQFNSSSEWEPQTFVEANIADRDHVHTINQLTDVTIIAAASDDMLVYTGGVWADRTPVEVQAHLSLVPGTDVQVFDAFLTSVALLGTAADRLVYSSGVDVAAETVFTAYARTLLADATATTARDTLELNSGQLGDIWLKRAGDTMTGAINMGSAKITNLGLGTNQTDAVTLSQLQLAQAGILVKQNVKMATTADLNTETSAVWTVGGSGVGKTLTSDILPSAIDGVTLANGDRVLVKNQTAADDNGLYVVSNAGGAGVILTRTEDYDGSPTAEVSHGTYVFVEEGTINDKSGWSLLETGLTGTGSPKEAVVDTDPLTFAKFQELGKYSAGAGIGFAGNVISVNFGAGIAEVPGGNVGVGIYTPNALILTTDGTALSTDVTAGLHLLLDSTTLVQSGTGLKVSSAGITEVELATSVAGDGLSGGAGIALSVNVDDVTIETNSDALRVKDGGISNVKLTNSTIEFTGDTSTDVIGLGETLSILGGQSLSTTVVAGTNTLTVDADVATDSALGVASFATDHFTVSSGVVTLNATLADLTNVDSGVDVNVAGASMVNDGADYKAVQTHYVIDSASSVSHTVTHNLNQKYVQVVVVEQATDEVIIPQSITFTNGNSLVVAVNVALRVVVIVSGVPGVALLTQ